MNTSLVYLMFASWFICGCATTDHTATKLHVDKNMANDDIAIRKLYADNAITLSAGDISALSRFYDKEIIQLPPNSPAMVGWESIRSTLHSELKGITVDATIEVVEVSISDDWAFARGTYRTVATPQKGGQQSEAKGNWLDILRRQQDGSWKIARSTWTNKE
jgi:uncharacterized protein (TIGR02246 family)